MCDERIEGIKNTLLSAIENQLSDLASVNAKELGEAVDMVKDLAEYCYYKTVVDAMNGNSQAENARYIDEYIPEIQKSYYSRMYYKDPLNMTHDSREGHAGISRKAYICSKENNDSDETTLIKLKDYLNDLMEDINDMVSIANSNEIDVVKSSLTSFVNTL